MSSPLEVFFESHDWDWFKKVNNWLVERSGDLVTLELHAQDKECYRVLFICDNYPKQAPKTFFVNSENSTKDKKTWPKGNAAFYEIVKLPPDSFLCMPLTREGLQHHPNWIQESSANAWDPNRHTLIDLFNFIQRLLNSKNYMGRAGDS